MAIGVMVIKEQLQKFLDCIGSAKPLEVPIEGWSANDLLALAGVCQWACRSQGPDSFKPRVPGAPDPKDRPLEHQEAAAEVFDRELITAVRVFEHASMLIDREIYDAECGPTCIATIGMDGEEVRLSPLAGFKNLPPVGLWKGRADQLAEGGEGI